jgi:membrane fusion protein (multidrug efflux system)
MRKWLVLVIGVLAVGGIAYALRANGIDPANWSGLKAAIDSIVSAQQPAPEASGPRRDGRGPLPVEVSRAVSTTLSDDIAAIGTLLAEEAVAISAETAGRVADILFEDGTRVAEGAPLFRLDADLARAAVTEAKARLALAEANYGRSQTLRKSGNVAQSVYDAALSELQVARAAVETTEVHLNKLTISAPFAGTLGFRTVSVGAYVNAGTALVELNRIDRLKVSFSVPELQQAHIALGQSIELTADAIPGETFTAVISAIDPAIDVNGRSLGVRADFDNAALKLRPGLLVRIAVKGPSREAVTIPESAIVQRGEGAVVFVVHDSTAAEQKVRLGKRMPGTIEIVEGIEAGADVVVAGNARLSNGAAIEIVPPPSAAE